MKRTKISRISCWVVGLAHIAEGFVIVLSLGAFSTGLPFRATMWAARKEAKIGEAR